MPSERILNFISQKKALLAEIKSNRFTEKEIEEKTALVEEYENEITAEVTSIVDSKKEVIQELKDDVSAKTLTKEEKLAKIQITKEKFEEAIEIEIEDNGFAKTKPEYGSLFELAEAEDDEDVKAAIIEQTYVFVAELNDEEKALFNYIQDDYLEDNPGYDDQGEWVSYVGSVPNPETGDYS